MATLRLLLVAALLALPLWVAQTAPAQACSFAPTTLEDDVNGADLIAVGVLGEMLVLPAESVADPETLPAGFMPVEAKFAVSEYLKGSGPATQLVYQPAEEITDVDGAITSILTSRSTCGTTLMRGDQFIMFLTRIDALRYATAVGTRNYSPRVSLTDTFPTEYVAQIRAAVAAERVGLPPTGSGPPHHGAPIIPLAAASALAGLALAANAAFALRRHK